MRSASAEFNKYVSSGGLFYIRATVKFANGKTIILKKGDFYISGNSYTDGAGASSLPVGVAMAKTLQICLVNDDDRFSECDFYHAKFIIRAYTDNVPNEYIDLGTFTVITPENYGNKITVTAVDDMYKADVDYETDLTFPSTIRAVIKDSAERLGIPIKDDDIPCRSYEVHKKPENITHRQLYGMIAMLIGGNARISEDNYLKFIGYDKNFLTQNTVNDGDLELALSQSGNISTDDVIITGVRIRVGSDSYLYGSEGYVLELNNDFPANNIENMIQTIGEHLVGLRFRPFSTESISNPLVEFADNCYVTDSKGNVYKSIVTDVEFAWLGKTKVKCSAESPLRNSSKYLSESAQQIAQVKKETGNILGKVDNIEKEQDALSSKVTAVEGQITAEATRAQGAESALSGRIDILPNDITLSVSDKKGSASISIKIDYEDGSSFTQTKTIDLDADTINLTASDIINLISDNTINLTANKIQFDSTNFSVDKDGNMTANNANLTGSLKTEGDYGTSYVSNGRIVIQDEDGRYLSLYPGYFYMLSLGDRVITMQNDEISLGGTYGGVASNTKLTGSGITTDGKITTKNVVETNGNSGATIIINPESSSESSVAYKTNNVTHWIVGHGCGSLGQDYFCWYNPTYANAMALHKNGDLTTKGSMEIGDGGLYIRNASTPFINFHHAYGYSGYTTRIIETEAGTLEVQTPDDKAKLKAYQIQSNACIMGTTTCRPITSGGADLGSSSYFWGEVFAKKGSINTSDANQKHDINKLDEKYEELFMSLQPVSYMFNDGDRIHIGAISQSVKDSMDKVGLSDLEFAGFCRDLKEDIPTVDEDGNEITEFSDEDYNYALRYSEFIMLNTHMIQKAYKKIEEQQNELNILRKELDEIKALLRKE